MSGELGLVLFDRVAPAPLVRFFVMRDFLFENFGRMTLVVNHPAKTMVCFTLLVLLGLLL